MIRQLLDYAGASSGEDAQVALDEDLLAVVLDLSAMQKGGKQITIDKQIEQNLFVRGSREGLQQVLLNCFLNAIDAIEARSDRQGGRINLSMQKQVVSIGEVPDEAVISIVDDGVGFDEADREKQFDPFFTTKEPGAG